MILQESVSTNIILIQCSRFVENKIRKSELVKYTEWNKKIWVEICKIYVHEWKKKILRVPKEMSWLQFEIWDEKNMRDELKKNVSRVQKITWVEKERTLTSCVINRSLHPGAPNHGFLLNALKSLLRLSRVLLDL